MWVTYLKARLHLRCILFSFNPQAATASDVAEDGNEGL